MKTKILLVLAATLVLGAVVSAKFVIQHFASKEAMQLLKEADRGGPPLPVESPQNPPPIKISRASADTNVQPEPLRTNPPPASRPVAAPRVYQAPQITPSLDPASKELIGRAALSYVGADPAADAVWTSLIYDSSLSEKVREDLMEDLNENGFSAGDGRRPTVDDLPLIESRIALLQEHMDGADEFMLAHLEEAYKDLMNMWDRLNGQ